MAEVGKWIDWNGGECPAVLDRLVDVRFRDGYQSPSRDGKDLRWSHIGSDGDIIAYRIVKPSYEGATPLEMSGGEQTAAVVATSPLGRIYTIPNDGSVKRYAIINFSSGQIEQSDTPDGFGIAMPALAHRLTYDAPHHGTCAVSCVYAGAGRVE